MHISKTLRLFGAIVLFLSSMHAWAQQPARLLVKNARLFTMAPGQKEDRKSVV